MTPPLDLDSLRRQYPEMPGWGERVFLELDELKRLIQGKSDWTAKDLSIVSGLVVGIVVPIIAALKGTGAV